VYQLLNLLDFTSDRKRMTVVLRFPDGKIRALMKGADTMVMARINKVRIGRGWDVSAGPS
jgi:magnesium-transporting ATPase (P-type)